MEKTFWVDKAHRMKFDFAQLGKLTSWVGCDIAYEKAVLEDAETSQTVEEHLVVCLLEEKWCM